MAVLTHIAERVVDFSDRWPRFFEFCKYFAASGVALVLDFTLLIVLTEVAGWHYLAATAAGFLAGSVCLYLISISVVFKERRLGNRRAEFVIFAFIGGIGLCITQVMMFGLVSLAGFAYPIAKIATVAVTFLFNFGARKSVLFKSSVSLGA